MTDGTATDVVPNPLAVAPTFAEYEALRNAGTPDDQGATDVRPESTDDSTGEEEGQDTTRTSAETEGTDGDADAGEKAAGDQAQGDLPKGVKKRLERAKRKTELARKEAEQWRKKFESLQGGDDGGGATSTATQDDDDAGDNQTASATEGEYDFDYPEESDYMDGDDDADGLSAYLADVERWENQQPLKGGAKATQDGDDQTQGRADDGADERQDQQQFDQNADPVQQQVNQMFSDLQEILEDSDGDENLAVDFFDQLQKGRFRLSKTMLEWMADNDESAEIADRFIKSPRVANRIFRAPETRHAQLLADLAKGDTKATPRSRDNAQGKTVVQDLTGSRSANKVTKLASAKSFSEYEKIRSSM